MPVYEYKCTSCGAREEHVLLSFSEAAPTACASCGKALKKVFGGRVGVSLNAWGFSKTDDLIKDTRGKDFRKLRARADKLRDE